MECIAECFVPILSLPVLSLAFLRAIDDSLASHAFLEVFCFAATGALACCRCSIH